MRHSRKCFSATSPDMHRIQIRTVRRSVLLAGAGLACAASAPLRAGAASTRRGVKKRGAAYPDKVLAVVKHLEETPWLLTGVPMAYEKDAAAPLPPALQGGLTAADVLPPPPPSPSAAGGGDPTHRSHYAAVVMALLYVAGGGLDAAHNLVTPYCWGSWTPYAGAPVTNSPAAQASGADRRQQQAQRSGTQDGREPV